MNADDFVIGTKGEESLPVVGRTGVGLPANGFDWFKRNVSHSLLVLRGKAEGRGQKEGGEGDRRQKEKGEEREA